MAECGILQIMNQEGLVRNHAFIKNTIENVCGLFNENKIDYHLGGAISGYLDSCGELVRCHNDIDINLNENDIGKVQQVLKKANTDFKFRDFRFKSPNLINGFGENGRVIKACPDKPHMHEVHAFYEDYKNFHLGFWIYEKNDSHASLKRFYTFAPTGQSMVIAYPQEIEEYNKMNTSINFRGLKIPCLSAEWLLNLKKNYYAPREKDKQDIEVWDNALQNR